MLLTSTLIGLQNCLVSSLSNTKRIASVEESVWREAFSQVLSQFEINDLLPEQKKKTRRSFLAGSHVFVNLPTGFGKSLIFQSLPIESDVINSKPWKQTWHMRQPGAGDFQPMSALVTNNQSKRSVRISVLQNGIFVADSRTNKTGVFRSAARRLGNQIVEVLFHDHSFKSCPRRTIYYSVKGFSVKWFQVKTHWIMHYFVACVSSIKDNNSRCFTYLHVR